MTNDDEDKNLARVDSHPSAAHGDLPSPAPPLSAHTPGPWTVHNMAIYGPFTPQGREACGVVVANMKQANRPRHEADARLIAAAPDLYAAIDNAMQWLEQTLEPCEKDCPCILHPLKAAMAKAEGR